MVWDVLSLSIQIEINVIQHAQKKVEAEILCFLFLTSKFKPVGISTML